jgi:hypothetical protein
MFVIARRICCASSSKKKAFIKNWYTIERFYKDHEENDRKRRQFDELCVFFRWTRKFWAWTIFVSDLVSLFVSRFVAFRPRCSLFASLFVLRIDVVFIIVSNIVFCVVVDILVNVVD